MVKSPAAPVRDGPTSPHRRKALVGLVGLTATVAFAPWATRATSFHQEGELFAFSAPDRDEVVFALAMHPPSLGKNENTQVSIRLHAGDYHWTFGPLILGQADPVLRSGDRRRFSGIVSRVDRRGEAAHLVAVSIPTERLPPRRLDVWADIVGADGAHSRIGNPVVSRLLADDARILRLHAGLAPGVDRRLLSNAVTRRMVTRPGRGAPYPGLLAGARRVADLMLPDTLGYHPRRPGGFTFAGMNGRRPEDAVDTVIRTILAGSPREGRNDLRYLPSGQFPYFASPIVA